LNLSGPALAINFTHLPELQILPIRRNRMHDPRPAKERSRLTMAPAPTPPPAPAPAAPAPAAPPKKHLASDLREFQLLDGRPLALLRGTVTFATPDKNDPETATVVGLRNSRAVPLRISYVSFMQWWLR
jgi:hypothetical protein